MKQTTIFTNRLEQDLTMSMAECAHDGVFILTDVGTEKYCLPMIKDFLCLKNAKLITIKQGEDSKTLPTATAIWETLSQNGASRHALLINLGGGMVSDIGGFAASTFKRGINFINIPTTLLAMVDASVGGKTGINMGKFKNEIGTFAEAKAVIIDTNILKTLPFDQLLSGYAEMIKHSLLDNVSHWADIMNFYNDDSISPEMVKRNNGMDGLSIDYKQLQNLVARSVAVKQRYVSQDPYDRGLRRSLNLGHTIGHALESWCFDAGSPVPHGCAVAYGLVCALYISCAMVNFPTDKMRQTVQFINSYYGRPPITCDDYADLIRLMKHDKKNKGDNILFTLLSDIGKPEINQIVDEKMIEESLDFLREG